MSPIATDPRTLRVLRFYEALTPQSVHNASTVYAENARFIDPFNDVTGCTAIQRVFSHMFNTLDAPRFEVLSTLTEGNQAMLAWQFRFRRQGRLEEMLVQGVSHLHYDADGRVALHQDHWDPASQLYEQLPVLGSVLRWLRRRLSAGR